MLNTNISYKFENRSVIVICTSKVLCWIGAILKFFTISEEKNLSKLSKRQKRLVRGSVVYNSLIQPGRTLNYKIYLGGDWKYPRLTDVSTLDGFLTEREGLKPICEFKASSLVNPKSVFSPHFYFDEMPVIDSGVRYIALTEDDSADDDAAIGRDYTFKENLYRNLEVSHPLALDYIREATRRKRIHDSKLRIKRIEGPDFDWANQRSRRPLAFITPGEFDQNAPEAVIVAMHWLQAGGAERWGMETVRLVKEAGMIPIVITNIDSHQPWITDPILDGVPVINLTFPNQDCPGDEPILRALFEQFNIRGVLIHHNQWMYDRLWWVKRYYPYVTVVDTTHILEYRWHGGFPVQSVRYDKFIDVHHVISPQLEDWMVHIQGIKASKVVDAPLAGLTAQNERLEFKGHNVGSPFTVAFVGRMNRQKRPDAFILLAERLHKAMPGVFRFILHGSGDIDNVVASLLDKRGLGNVVEWRSMDIPVAQTYADSDLLVISSVNEGITLTTFEALSAGIPVISANVGSQKTLIPDEALLGTCTEEFLNKASALIRKMNQDESSRKGLWSKECSMLADFNKLELADHLFSRLLSSWK